MVKSWPSAIAAGWHPIAFSASIGTRRPLAVRLMGRRLVVARDETHVFVLDDRCPHRGAPLSRGRMASGVIACPYHGWTFDRKGHCISVPGSTAGGVSTRLIPSIDRAGLIWVSLAEKPADFPRLPTAMEDPTLDRFWWPLNATRASLLDAVENHLDPAHPHYVHPWIVRAPNHRRPVDVTVRSGPWGAEAVYRECAQASGLMPRLLEGVRTTSIGRLYPPTIAEVAFERDGDLRLSIAVVFGPEDHGLTRPWAHFATQRGTLPAAIKRFVLKAFHRPVLAQDRRMLALQEEWRGHDRPNYAIGPLDIMGPSIWRLANAMPEPERECRLSMTL